MIIAVGRSLLFINATEGKSYFENLCDHNLNQARARILEWQGGRPIRGQNEFQSFAIAWEDIDHIAVISVVDGPHAACLAHSIITEGMPEKVRICCTITSDVMRDLARLGGGARDLLAFCKSISEYGVVTAENARSLLSWRYDGRVRWAKAQIPNEPKWLGATIIKGRPVTWFDEFRVIFEGKRRHGQIPNDFSDLNWDEIFSAVIFITNSAAEMEASPDGQIRSAIIGHHWRFQVVVSSIIEGLAEYMDGIMERANQANCTFTYIVILASFGISGMIAMNPGLHSWALDAEMAALV
ncbi:hypothetical protein [Rhizobium etli]|nr:hypothetical protein [Rhizobium etli]